MSGSIGSNRSLALGLGISVLVHSALGVGLARYGTFLAAPWFEHPQLPDPSRAAERRPSPTDLLTLGIEQSQAVTETWLGFENPTNHSGPKATVEQADMGPKVGAPVAQAGPGAVSPSRPEQDPIRPPPSALANPPSLEAAPAADPAPAAYAGEKPADAAAAPEPTPAPENPAPRADPTDPQRSNAEFVGPPVPPALPEVVPSPPAQDARPSQARPGEAAEQAEREATAAYLKEAVEVKPGRPVAAKGLKIETVRPRWSITTQITASPRNPVVKVTFGRSGKVLRAEFVGGQNTGWAEVDGPLMDAIYRWRAKGEALAKLPAGNPDAGLPIVFRIVLRTN